MNDKKVFKFAGKEVDVYWDGRLCIHIGECGQSQGELFVGGRDPWCLPDITSSREVCEICERCPSGALTYSDKSGQVEQAPAENKVVVSYNGPLYVSGDLEIIDGPEDMPGIRYRVALCRCGQSKNKPFCDNSHLKGKFEDFAAIGEKGPGLQSKGGKLQIKSLPDGPLLLNGNLSIMAGSGRLAWQGVEVALCRCGGSKNKPFCDGSHRKIGFKG